MNLLIFKIVNALIFFGLIGYFGRKPFRKFFLDRSRALRDTIVKVSRQKEGTESRLRELRAKLDQVDAETAELIQEFKTLGAVEKKNLIQKAEKYSERLHKETLRIGTQELGRAESILKIATIGLALSMAEHAIQNEITSEDQSRLIGWGIEKLPEAVYEA